MIYRIVASLNDGLSNDPGFEIEVDDAISFLAIDTGSYLGDVLIDELCNDYGIPFGVGAKVTIERIK